MVLADDARVYIVQGEGIKEGEEPVSLFLTSGESKRRLSLDSVRQYATSNWGTMCTCITATSKETDNNRRIVRSLRAIVLSLTRNTLVCLKALRGVARTLMRARAEGLDQKPALL